ncbi:M2 family metallopeptidase [Cohnella soli]|uniref:M2 family metallopeptidase n=1 Tax=Cohnella soli TaxID=425005 RepID=A0ABW0I1W1_9BACL
MIQAHDAMNSINRTLSGVYSKMMNALWMVLATGEARWADEFAVSEVDYHNTVASSSLGEQVGLLKTSGGLDRLVDRQLLLLQNERLEHSTDAALREQITQRWNELHYTISTYRTKINDTSLSAQEVDMLLRSITDETERERLWRNNMQLGESIAPGLLELVRLRNRTATENGFADYFEMQLYSQEIDPNDLDRHIYQLRKLLDQSYRKAKAQIDWEVSDFFRISPNVIRPWHYTHPFIPGSTRLACDMKWSLSTLLPRLSSWLNKNHINIDSTLQTADWLERPGKNQANCCLNIDRANDIRILCNVRPDRSGLRILLHEVGHAVYESQLSSDLPFILRQPAHIFLSEAIALLFERLLDEEEWLDEMGLQDGRRRSDKEAIRMRRLVRIYWTIVVVQFERELYRNPEGALNDIWWSQMESVMGVSRPDVNWNSPYWAAVPHLTTLPVYYYNYLLGEIASSQIRHMSNVQFGSWYNENALSHLKETLFRSGASSPWDVLLMNCTTCKLDTQFMVEEFDNERSGDGWPEYT